MWWSVLFNCGIPLTLLLLGLIVGTMVERSHFRKLDEHEGELKGMLVTDLKTVPPGVEARAGVMISAGVVVASDYFKTMMAALRKIIGGEVRSYQRLMERARREALVRLLRQAHELGAKAIINVRYETSNIGAVRRNPAPMVEVLVYGTAVM